MIQGYISDAQVVYNTLQDKFPVNQAGGIYTGMAIAVWDKYQTTQDIGAACQIAISYAESHKEDFFQYLGNIQFETNTFGSQSHNYIVDDVCPFK